MSNYPDPYLKPLSAYISAVFTCHPSRGELKFKEKTSLQCFDIRQIYCVT